MGSRQSPTEFVSIFSDSIGEIGDLIREYGGAGLYPTDMILHCNVNDILQLNRLELRLLLHHSILKRV